MIESRAYRRVVLRLFIFVMGLHPPKSIYGPGSKFLFGNDTCPAYQRFVVNMCHFEGIVISLLSQIDFKYETVRTYINV